MVVIGAGASGLFCAAQCAGRGRSVLVLDHADRACAKVLVSGGGWCNFTNLHMAPEHFRSANPHFCRSALARFTPQDLTDLLRHHHVAFREKEAGQLFCAKGARELAAILERRCREAGVAIALSCKVRKVFAEQGFVVETDRGTIRSASLVIATGGLSYPGLGASGFGHSVAKQFGLAVIATRPALVPLVYSGQDRKRYGHLAGIAITAAIACTNERFPGNILFTHRGLSGPAVLQVSSAWQPGIPVAIDLFPGGDLAALLAERRKSRMELRTLLAGRFPKRFAETWCAQHFPSRPLADYSDKELRTLAGRLRAWEIRPAGTEGFARAEVTAGGVDTACLSSKTMEAKNVPGLYFIGEVMDVTGELGGYNLHWAWASGFAAGQYA